jgi:hypothetical protein
MFVHICATKNAECFQRNFAKIFVLFTIQTFVEVPQAAFSVLISRTVEKWSSINSNCKSSGTYSGSTEKGSSISFNWTSSCLDKVSQSKDQFALRILLPIRLACAEGYAILHKWESEWHISPLHNWLLKSYNFILKAFSAAKVWNISWCFPWSWMLRSFRCAVIS